MNFKNSSLIALLQSWLTTTLCVCFKWFMLPVDFFNFIFLVVLEVEAFSDMCVIVTFKLCTKFKDFLNC